jgi:elongation factor P
MIINATQIRKNIIIIHNGQPHKVMDFRFTMQARGGNTIPVKLRNILTGSQAEVRFRSDDKVDVTDIDERQMQFVYEHDSEYWFMDTETFEQVPVPAAVIEDVRGYCVAECVCRVQFYESRPIGAVFPPAVHLRVEETEPAVKDATASGRVTKPATLETGLVLQVPMFVQKGDIVIVSTQTGEYQGRPGKI